MKALQVLLLATLLFCVAPISFADDISLTTAATTAGTASAPAPVMTPVPPGTSLPAVAVAEPSAPPQWAQELIVVAEKLPVVGPFVAKALLWTGIISGILTTIVGALVACIQLLLGVFNVAGFVSAGNALVAFRDGKIMYWLKYFSMFNAKKNPTV